MKSSAYPLSIENPIFLQENLEIREMGSHYELLITIFIGYEISPEL